MHTLQTCLMVEQSLGKPPRRQAHRLPSYGHLWGNMSTGQALAHADTMTGVARPRLDHSPGAASLLGTRARMPLNTTQPAAQRGLFLENKCDAKSSRFYITAHLSGNTIKPPPNQARTAFVSDAESQHCSLSTRMSLPRFTGLQYLI